MFLATRHSGRLLLFLNHLVPLLTNGSMEILTEQQKQATSAGKSFGMRLNSMLALGHVWRWVQAVGALTTVVHGTCLAQRSMKDTLRHEATNGVESVFAAED